MKASLRRAFTTETENWFGKMVIFMRDPGKEVGWMDPDYINEMMAHV